MDNKYLSRDGVSHLYLLIKNKLTTYFKTLFVSKRDGYDLSQNDFTNELKTKLENMDSAGLTGAVRYDVAQGLTDEEKAQARANIGAGTGDGTGSIEGTVRYDVEQALDDDDKVRARANIGAGTSNFDGDYSSLINRPVYGEVLHSFFDGSETPSPEHIEILGQNWYKVSDLTPSKEQMANADLYVSASFPLSHKLTDEYIALIGEKEGKTTYIMYAFDNMQRMISVIYTTETIEGEFQGQPFEFTAPSEGIYWALSSNLNGITFEIEYKDIKQLDDMYIPNNIPRLNDSGLIPAENLPSYVDDVIEGYLKQEDNLFYAEAEFITVITGEDGKIYVDMNDNGGTYRWSGSTFVKIESSVGLTALTNTEIDEIIASVDSSTE